MRLEKPVFNVVYRWLWNRQDAHEVVQEAFMRLWKMRERVRMDTVEPLVYRIAVNLASKHKRRKKLWGWLSFDGEQPQPADPAAHAPELMTAAQRERRVRAAVDALPDKLRQVVVLCELTGMSYAQVGEALGVPAGTVGSRRNTALRRLRDTLGEGGLDEA